MLHRCSQCDQLFLVSNYRRLCNYCGEQLRQQLELQVDDGVKEWWRLAIEAEFGMEPERTRIWWIT